MSTTDYVPAVRRKVLVAVGTRPEAIKLLPLVRGLHDDARMEPFVIATGQHPGVVESILELDGLAPSANLAVGRPGLGLNELFATIMEGFERFCVEQFGPAGRAAPERDYNVYPAACVVHGDTSSAAAAAVAAFHLQIPVVHVEAGLRTSDIRSPYPEELNRQLISRIAALHLAPTSRNLQNLVREAVPAERVFVTGNTAIDALQWAAGLQVPYGAPELACLEDDDTTPVVVVTAHRRENWGSGLDGIDRAVRRLAQERPGVRFVLPLHPNPVVAQTFRGLLEDQPNVLLVPPMTYPQFARLLHRAMFAISDSGGVQEEAPALGTPVLVTRRTTERQEGVDAGTLRLVGTDQNAIVEAATELIDSPEARWRMTAAHNPYGDGRAAERIVAAFAHVAFAGPEPQPFGCGFNRLSVLRAGGFDDDPRVIGRPAPGRGEDPQRAPSLIEEVALR